jgi:hypothetical protein
VVIARGAAGADGAGLGDGAATATR